MLSAAKSIEFSYSTTTSNEGEIMSSHAAIREEELTNRIAALYFGKYDCGRIVGNIDFCVSQNRRDPRQMTFIPDAPILWAEAKVAAIR